MVNLSLTELERLESLDGLEGLTKLDGSLALSRSPKLASLDALGGLSQIGGSLEVVRLPSLVTLAGLGTIGAIGGNLIIDSNAALTDLDALEALRRIGGTYFLTFNPALTSASFRSEVPGYPTVEGGIAISNNGSLRTLSAFGVRAPNNEPCDVHSVRGGVSIQDNEKLEVLELPGGQYTNILVADNERLTTVSGQDPARACSLTPVVAPQLEPIRPARMERRRPRPVETGLVALDGLDQTVVNCSRHVSENSALSALSPLSPGSSVGYDLNISQNASLPACAVEALVDDLRGPTTQCIASGHVSARPRIVSIADNDDSARCE